jgi:hypothetical protein
MANEHRHEINQFILAHPGSRKSHPFLDGFEHPVSLERMSHHSHFPKPGRRTRQVRRVHLDVDDRIGHLPLLPFSLVFSQEDTFLSSLPVFQGFLPLLAPSSLTRCVSRGFIEHLGFCQPTEARKITFEESLVFEKIHEETYTSLGYDLLKIAPDALSVRVHRIMEGTSYTLDKR